MKKRSDKVLRIGITVGAVIIAIIHLARPDLKIDGVTLVLLVIALIPWMSPIIKSIELPGGFKVELQEIKQEIAEMRGAAQSTENKVQFALAQKEQILTPGVQLEKMDGQSAAYDQLTAEYNQIRLNQHPGQPRTANMTRVVSEMITLAPQVFNLDIDSRLNSSDAGKRISAYAYLYALPDFNRLTSLVNSLTGVENQAFGQYWGIQAIDKTINSRPAGVVVDETVLSALRRFQSGLKIGTDRYYDLTQILRSFGDGKI